MSPSHHEWTPISVAEAVDLLTGAPFRWWIGGGHALELHLGRSWRSHNDLDIGICRYQVQQAHKWLTKWDLHVAAAGNVAAWDGHELRSERHENNVWARQEAAGPWRFDLTIGDGTDERWIFRRDPSLSRPWDQAILVTDSGVPYFAPELQLLFKSKRPRDKDQVDAEIVIPALGAEARQFLDRRLAATHQWRSLLEQH